MITPSNPSLAINPVKTYEVASPPDDSVSSMAFSPACMTQNFLLAGSWDGVVRCWEVETSGMTVLKTAQYMQGPVLDVCWCDDGTKVFMAGSDRTAVFWDLATNQSVPVAFHEAPVKTCRWIKSPTYSCLMTGSWDRTLRFWDPRTEPQAVMTISLPERCFCADADYPMAVVGTADRSLIVYRLEGSPQEYTRINCPLKHQMRCVTIFRSKEGLAIGFAIGGTDGRVTIQNLYDPSRNLNFKCHRADNSAGYCEIYVVNDIAFHPIHGTLATVGSDGRFFFWDKDTKRKLLESDFMDQPLTTCAIAMNGQIFAYSVCYDWSRGHEYNDPTKKTKIFLRPCFEELKPQSAPSNKI